MDTKQAGQAPAVRLPPGGGFASRSTVIPKLFYGENRGLGDQRFRCIRIELAIHSAPRQDNVCCAPAKTRASPNITHILRRAPLPHAKGREVVTDVGLDCLCRRDVLLAARGVALLELGRSSHAQLVVVVCLSASSWRASWRRSGAMA